MVFMKKNLTKLLVFLAVFFSCGLETVWAQDSANNSTDASSLPKPAESQFMVVGLTTFGFVNQNTTNRLGGVKTTDKSNSLGDVDRYEFSPMFLWRHGDNLLLEFEPSFDGSNLGVNWADVSYFAAPGLTIRAGYLVLPFGTYNKRLAAGWINKLTSDPIGTDVAGSDFGVEVEGGLPLGNMKWSYDVSLTNGFMLNNDGTMSGVGIDGISAGNNGKTVCGRLSLLPFSNSSFEVGVSGLYGSMATDPNATYSNINANSTKGPATAMYAVDLNWVKNFNPIQINAKGQYSYSHVNNMNYFDTASGTGYTFANNTKATFGQVSIRPAFATSKVLKNLELAFRYVNYKTPNNSTWGQNYNEEDVSLDYWMSWRTVIKLGYEAIKSDGTSNTDVMGAQGTTNISRLILQFSVQF
jgi:hypothetical protein